MMTFGVGYTLTVWTDNRPLQLDTTHGYPKKVYTVTFWRHRLSDTTRFLYQMH
jgi:hypothetical protein